ncbi:transposase [Bacteroidota bacterium]
MLSYAYYAVDLYSIDCVSHNLVMTIISELGHGYKKFSSSKEFTSYLRLAPNNKISKGKILTGRTPKGKNVLGKAFRDAANTVGLKKSGSLNAFFKRKAYQKGRGAAITATARKLATIVWHMLMYKNDYTPMSEEVYNEKIKQRTITNINQKMKRLGIKQEELNTYKPLHNLQLQKC